MFYLQELKRSGNVVLLVVVDLLAHPHQVSRGCLAGFIIPWHEFGSSRLVPSRCSNPPGLPCLRSCPVRNRPSSFFFVFNSLCSRRDLFLIFMRGSHLFAFVVSDVGALFSVVSASSCESSWLVRARCVSRFGQRGRGFQSLACRGDSAALGVAVLLGCEEHNDCVANRGHNRSG